MMPLNARFLEGEALAALGLGAWGSNVKVHPFAVIPNPQAVFLGSNVRIDAFTVLSAKEIHVGAYTHIAAGVSIVGQSPCVIGQFCGISHGSRIFTSTDDLTANTLTNPLVPSDMCAVRSERVHIESHCIVGAMSVVMPGVRMGKGAILGVHGYVKEEIPAFEIWGGIPAKMLKPRSRKLEMLESELIKRMGPIE